MKVSNTHKNKKVTFNLTTWVQLTRLGFSEKNKRENTIGSCATRRKWEYVVNNLNGLAF